MTSLANIDPVLLNMSSPVNPTRNPAASQDGQGVDGNSIPGARSTPPPRESPAHVDAPLAPLALGTNQTDSRVNYKALKLDQLKALCRSRKLRVGGRKHELANRLENADTQQASSVSTSNQLHTPPPISDTSHFSASAEGQRLPDDVPDIRDLQTGEVNSKQVNSESAALETYFQAGFHQEDSDDEDDEAAGEVDNDSDSHVVDNVKTHDALAWADRFILETRRRGGRQTENSVLKQWKSWASQAIDSGTLPDIIVDANHTIEYLKYAATRELFNTRGQKKVTTTDRLSASSLKKIMTMLGRVRRRQEDENAEIRISRPAKTSRTEDFYKAVMVQAQRLRLESDNFDITKGTILDSELRPEHFDEVTASIFRELNQLPSIIKAHFSWTWQCSTLNRSDELVSLLMACIQPFHLRLPNYTEHNGQISPINQEVFGVLALFHETKTAQPGKTEPTYSYVLPHRNPLRCPVGALAILLHFMFDQENLLGCLPDWDWNNSASWRQVHVLFGKGVAHAITGDAIGRMYTTFLEHTSITSNKKTHLARRTFPTLLEEMGVPADQVDASGHWLGNTRREVYGSKIPKVAAVALAGFPVGESYVVPWAQVQVPESLQRQIFPFCEDALAKLRVNGCKNQGTLNFLELLRSLRPFFWRAISAIRTQFPESAIVKRLRVVANSEAKSFFQQWPDLLCQEERVRRQSSLVERTFQETPTRHAFSSVSTDLHELKRAVATTNSQLSVISRRTEHFSPSKRRSHRTSSPSPFIPSSPLPFISSQTKVPVFPPSQTPSSASPFLPLHQPISESFGAAAALPPKSLTPLIIPANSTTAIANPSPATFTPGLNPPVNAFPSAAMFPPTQSLPNLLTPLRVILSSQITYHVLPVSLPVHPGQPPPRTQQDLVLPPCSAFSLATYPPFTTRDCTWQYIFDRITEPSYLWLSYAPGSLGDYPDVKSLWQAWDEGTFMPDIGRKPALRLIDARWGNLKSQETHQRRFPSWRPRNNEKARKIWSNFFFFVHRIEEKIKSGISSDAAVSHFDNLRDKRSLSQLHASLQTKKRKHNDTIDH